MGFLRDQVRWFLVGLLVTFYVEITWGYSRGAPSRASVCKTLTPEHGVSPQQQIQSLYRMSLSKRDLSGGETLVIKIEPLPRGIFFKGFLVAVKKPGDNENSLGSFKIADSHTQTINCFGKSNNLVTHKSNDDKANVTLNWIAPNEDIEELEVIYTVVQEHETFWQVTNPNKISVRKERTTGGSSAVKFPTKETDSAGFSGVEMLRNHYRECDDETHGCMGIPRGCIEQYLHPQDSEDSKATCNVLLSWTKNGDRNSYKMSGNPGGNTGYIAMGFSTDTLMGNDSVVGCYIAESGRVVVRRFHNTARPNSISGGTKDDRRGIMRESSQFVDGYIFCDFDQTDHKVGTLIDVKIRESKYNILLARGKERSPGDNLPSHELSFDDIGVSENQVDIETVGRIETIERKRGNGKGSSVLAEVSWTLEEMYGECKDERHGCMGIPRGCTKDPKQTCSVLLSWAKNGVKNSYKMSGKVEADTGYIAMGFSTDKFMGNDSVVGCYRTESGVVVQRFHNTKKTERIESLYNAGTPGDLQGITNPSSKFVDGRIFCAFDQTDHTIGKEESFIDVKIRELKYHILLAKGKSSSGENLHKHAFTSDDIGVSEKKVDIGTVGVVETIDRDSGKGEVSPVSSEVSSKLRETYGACKDGSHGCTGIPAGCIERFLEKDSSSPPCTVMLSWSVEGSKNSYKMSGKPQNNNGYVAMAFSDDPKMGTDSVVGCYGADNAVQVGRFKNVKGKKSNEAHENSGLGLSNQKGSITDGHFFCSFDQTDHSLEDMMEIKIRDSKYHILLARGSSGGSGGLGIHSFSEDDIGMSAEKLDITHVGIVGASSSSPAILLKLHGAFMIVAWLVCASTGMFTARYYKLTYTEFMPLKKAFWFIVHISCMCLTVILTAVGAVFIFVKKDGWHPADGKWWHPILGVVLFGLAALQVVIAFFRPHPGTDYRPLFNWIHWTIGNSAHVVGITCILLAYDLDSAGLDARYLTVGLLAVAFHVMMHLTLSFHTYFTDKEMGVVGKTTQRAWTGGPMKSNGLTTEAPGTSFRMLMMGLYFIGLLGCALALIIFISMPQQDKNSSKS